MLTVGVESATIVACESSGPYTAVEGDRIVNNPSAAANLADITQARYNITGSCEYVVANCSDSSHWIRLDVVGRLADGVRHYVRIDYEWPGVADRVVMRVMRQIKQVTDLLIPASGFRVRVSVDGGRDRDIVSGTNQGIVIDYRCAAPTNSTAIVPHGWFSGSGSGSSIAVSGSSGSFSIVDPRHAPQIFYFRNNDELRWDAACDDPTHVMRIVMSGSIVDSRVMYLSAQDPGMPPAPFEVRSRRDNGLDAWWPFNNIKVRYEQQENDNEFTTTFTFNFTCTPRSAAPSDRIIACPGTAPVVLTNDSKVLYTDPDGPDKHIVFPKVVCTYDLTCSPNETVQVDRMVGDLRASGYIWQASYTFPKFSLNIADDLAGVAPNPIWFRDSVVRVFFNGNPTISAGRVNGALLEWTCREPPPNPASAPIIGCAPRASPLTFNASHDVFMADPNIFAWAPRSRDDCYFEITCPNRSHHLLIEYRRRGMSGYVPWQFFAYGPPHRFQMLQVGDETFRWWNYTVLLRNNDGFNLGLWVNYTCVEPLPEPHPWFETASTRAAAPAVPPSRPTYWVDVDGPGRVGISQRSAEWKWVNFTCPSSDQWVHLYRITGAFPTGTYLSYVYFYQPDLRLIEKGHFVRNHTFIGHSVVSVGVYTGAENYGNFGFHWGCVNASEVGPTIPVMCPFNRPPETLRDLNGSFMTDPDGNGPVYTWGRSGNPGCRVNIECPTVDWTIDVNISVGDDGNQLNDVIFRGPNGVVQSVMARRLQTFRFEWLWGYTNITYSSDLRNPTRRGIIVSYACIPPRPMLPPDMRCNSTTPLVLTNYSRALLSDLDGAGPLHYLSRVCRYTLSCPNEGEVVELLRLKGEMSYGNRGHRIYIETPAGQTKLGDMTQPIKANSLPAVLPYSNVTFNFFGTGPLFPGSDGRYDTGWELEWNCTSIDRWDRVNRGCPRDGVAENTFIGTSTKKALWTDFDGALRGTRTPFDTHHCVWHLRCPSPYTTLVISDWHMDRERAMQIFNVTKLTNSTPAVIGGPWAHRNVVQWVEPRQHMGIDASEVTVEFYPYGTQDSTAYGGFGFSFACDAVWLRPRILTAALPAAPATSTVTLPSGEITASGWVGKRLENLGYGSRAKRLINISCPTQDAILVVWAYSLNRQRWSLDDEFGRTLYEGEFVNKRLTLPRAVSTVVVNTTRFDSANELSLRWECRCPNASAAPGTPSSRWACGPRDRSGGRPSEDSQCHQALVDYPNDNDADGCLCRTVSEDVMCTGRGYMEHGDPVLFANASRIKGPSGGDLPCICMCQWPYRGPRCEIVPDPWPPTPSKTVSETESWTEDQTISRSFTLQGTPSFGSASPSMTPAVSGTQSESVPKATITVEDTETASNIGTISVSEEQTETVNPYTPAPPRIVGGRTMTSTLIPPKPFVASELGQITGGATGETATAVVAVVSVGTGGAAAADLQVLALVALMPCADEEARESGKNAVRSVFPFEVAAAGYAARIAGLAIIVGGVLIAQCIAVVAAATFAQRTFPTAFHAATKLRLPDISLRVAALALQGLAFEASRMCQVDAAWDSVFTGIGAVTGVVAFTLCFWVVQSHVARRIVLEPFDAAEKQIPKAVHPLIPHGYWLPMKDRTRFGVTFNNVRPRRIGFAWVVPARAVVLGAITAVVAETEAQCRAQLLAMAGVQVAFVLTVAATTPHRKPTDNVFVSMNALATAVVFVVYAVDSLHDSAPAAYFAASVVTAITALGALAIVGFESRLAKIENDDKPTLEKDLDTKHYALLAGYIKRQETQQRQRSASSKPGNTNGSSSSDNGGTAATGLPFTDGSARPHSGRHSPDESRGTASQPLNPLAGGAGPQASEVRRDGSPRPRQPAGIRPDTYSYKTDHSRNQSGSRATDASPTADGIATHAQLLEFYAAQARHELDRRDHEALQRADDDASGSPTSEAVLARLREKRAAGREERKPQKGTGALSILDVL